MILHDDIPAALGGERLDRVVALVAGCSRSVATEWIAAGRVAVDDTVVTARTRHLEEGAKITIDVPEQPDERPEGDATVPFEVVHVDADVIVVDKPAGLVVHPGSGHPDGTLVNGLVARFPDLVEVGQRPRPGIVHRLDRGTSGLLVVARTQTAYEALVADLAAHRVRRDYQAMVVGTPQPGRGLVDAPIGRSARFATRMTVTATGKPARTHYEVAESFVEPFAASLVDCSLETGRTHQIRVHLAAISHPVLGDTTYGGGRSELRLDRPFLHARALGFSHPVTKEGLEFSSPLPTDLQDVLARFTNPTD